MSGKRRSGDLRSWVRPLDRLIDSKSRECHRIGPGGFGPGRTHPGRRTGRTLDEGNEQVTFLRDGLETLFKTTVVASAEGRALLRHRERMARLERLLDVGLLVLNRDGAVVLANERAREMLGLHDRNAAEIEQLINRLVEATPLDGGSSELELRPSGRPLRATISSCEGSQDRLVELRDSTALAGVEADLMIAARVRNLTRLYVGLTHDLKAPLNAIILHLELLRRDLRRSSTATEEEVPERLERIAIVEAELNRLQRTLGLLLEQAVPLVAERCRFDLRDAVSELGDLLRAPARQADKEVDVHLPARATTVEARRDQVKQALLNVALNGIEAMSDGGRLRLAVSRRGDHAVVTISDSGPGIDAEIQPRLFDFYVSGKEAGVGAGLYFARSLLEAEGGTIELTSTSSEGTTFTVELPTARD